MERQKMSKSFANRFSSSTCTTKCLQKPWKVPNLSQSMRIYERPTISSTMKAKAPPIKLSFEPIKSKPKLKVAPTRRTCSYLHVGLTSRLQYHQILTDNCPFILLETFASHQLIISLLKPDKSHNRNTSNGFVKK